MLVCLDEMGPGTSSWGRSRTPQSAKSFAGQMVVGQTPVTFCFIVNWNGPTSDFSAIEDEFFAAIKGILTAIKQARES